MRDAGTREALGTEEAAEALAAARSLAEALTNGACLEPMAVDDAPLGPGECAYADLSATGWRYVALDATAYERRVLLVGGPYVMAMTMLITALGNRRRRQEAERAATPQWRPLGPLRVIVTSDRLVVWHGEAWWSVWLDAVTGVRVDAANCCVDLVFDADPPYRLAGSHMPSLGVVLTHAVAARGVTAAGEETAQRIDTCDSGAL